MKKSRKDNRGRVLNCGEIYIANEDRYRFSYTDRYGKRYHLYAKDLKTLREKEEKVWLDTHDGINSYLSGHVTLNETFDRYMACKSNLRRTTKHNYIYMYNKFVRDSFGKNMLCKIRFSDVKAFYNSLVELDGMQPNTAATIHCFLRPTFEMAVRDEIIRSNPCAGAMEEINKCFSHNKGVRHALTLPQQQAFMDYIHDHPVYGHWYNAFAVLIGTGLRCGEFIGLRWEDIDMEERTINVNHTLVRVPREAYDRRRRLGVSLPKTDAGVRTIPMLDSVYEAFKSEYEFQSSYGFCEANIEGMTNFIFYNANGNPLCEQNINSAIKRILESYHMEEEVLAAKEGREPLIIPHFSCHHLRHTFCTRYCENETNIKAIQSVMGHKNSKTTLDIYAEATSDVKIESMGNFSKVWDDKIKR